jgi:hypothetical protein
LEVIYK